jgi:dCTP deaminase
VILSQPELRQEVKAGRIKFSPELEENQWGEASIDLRLGARFVKLKPLTGVKLSVAQGLPQLTGFWDGIDLPLRDAMGKRATYSLDPEEFVLALTHETVTVPRHLIARVEGRSTYARMGISMHQTAPWIQPGWSGQITLEIKNSGPIPIELTPLADRLCQITFFKLTSEVPESQAYGSRATDKYAGQTHPMVHSKKAAVTVPATTKQPAKKKKRPKARAKAK